MSEAHTEPSPIANPDELEPSAGLHPEAAKLFADDAWSEHSEFPREDWRYEVGACDTQLGYWQWLTANLYDAEDEADQGGEEEDETDDEE